MPISTSIDVDAEVDVVRAWADVEYRDSLTEAQLAELPASPVGNIEGIATDDLQNGGSLALSILSPAACFFTMACTGACCAW